MTDRDAPQQPIPERNHAPGDPKENAYGESEAQPSAEGGKTKYDKPSEGSEDFSIDEDRDKRIRGNEAPKDT
ncbi:hypothetical protein [uncultured Jannaschia sp.]|uniref:hypothetical protein n=1 Tax=uncultured Jannaschia sp. TaxID=293347 RepID=UPI002619658D|nr:hypothetical protein [uncultured Jannaschia sp.]